MWGWAAASNERFRSESGTDEELSSCAVRETQLEADIRVRFQVSVDGPDPATGQGLLDAHSPA